MAFAALLDAADAKRQTPDIASHRSAAPITRSPAWKFDGTCTKHSEPIYWVHSVLLMELSPRHSLFQVLVRFPCVPGIVGADATVLLLLELSQGSLLGRRMAQPTTGGDDAALCQSPLDRRRRHHHRTLSKRALENSARRIVQSIGERQPRRIGSTASPAERRLTLGAWG